MIQCEYIILHCIWGVIMAQTNINIRIDEKLKKQFEAICSELGFNMSTAFNVFARAMVRKKGMPFELTINEYNEETIQAINDAENGIGLSKAYTDLDEMFRDLEADD